MLHVRVGLVIGTDGKYARSVLCGVSRFVRDARMPWLFWLTPHNRPDFRPLARWKPDAVIAHLINSRQADRVEAWTSVVRTLSRTATGPDLLDALVRLAHPAAPQPV